MGANIQDDSQMHKVLLKENNNGYADPDLVGTNDSQILDQVVKLG
jgi:hypothetical protein